VNEEIDLGLVRGVTGIHPEAFFWVVDTVTVAVN